MSRLDDGMVTWLEQAIDGYMAEVDLPPKFVIPGGTQLSAQLDVARSVLRRAERRIVALAESEDLGDSAVLKYVNRASDLLFAMARFADVPEPELFEGRGRHRRRPSEGQRPAPQGLRAHRHRRAPHADRRRARRAGRRRHRPAPDGSCSALSLASCTAITIEMYADRKEWDVGDLEVEVDYELDPKATSRFDVLLKLPARPLRRAGRSSCA